MAGWLQREVTWMSSALMKAETAASVELGYTWGRYTADTGAGARAAYYVRVWTRQATGVWRLVADVTTLTPAR
ncbi:MAG: hypothetical protein ACT4QD_06130 [Acidobacteriota bacterium]